MATIRWRGDAVAVQQITTLVVGGTIESSDIFIVTINGKDVSMVAGSTSASTVASALCTLLQASDIPEFQEVTWTVNSATITATITTAGIPVTITGTTTETGGGAADSQNFVVTTTTAATGPNFWDNADNWSGGAVPVNNDHVYIEDSDVDILYGFAQSAVTLDSLNISMSYTGSLGLPYNNSLGYVEYRTRKLAIGATAINIGYGTGGGPKRVQLNTGSVQTTGNVSGSGTSPESGPAIRWIGTHASNVWNINRGTFGAANEPGEAATILTFGLGYVNNVVGDATAVLGAGCTLTTINQSGGSLTVGAALTTWTMTDGLAVHLAGAITTLNLDGGAFYYQSTGTLTTVKVGGDGSLNFTRDMRARTVTNAEMNAGSAIIDSFKTVTWTNGIDLVRCTIAEVTLDLGTHITLTPSAI